MTLRKALFKVIKFNQDLLNLSARIGQHPKLNNGAYIGVHLRGEKDWPNEFGVVADQMRFYVAEIQRIQKTVSYNLKTIYVSVSSSTSSTGLPLLTPQIVRRRRCNPAVQGYPQATGIYSRIKVHLASFLKQHTRTGGSTSIRPESHSRVPDSCRCSILDGSCYVFDVVFGRLYQVN